MANDFHPIFWIYSIFETLKNMILSAFTGNMSEVRIPSTSSWSNSSFLPYPGVCSQRVYNKILSNHVASIQVRRDCFGV